MSQTKSRRDMETTRPGFGHRFVTRSLWATTAVGLILGGLIIYNRWTPDQELPIAVEPSTATIQRGDISVDTSWDGVLVYSDQRELVFRTDSKTSTQSPGGSSGSKATVTRLAPLGSTVNFGEELYRVDDQPVILLEGNGVLWRTLEVGSSGSDVLMIEQLLSDLGYDPDGLVIIDEEFQETSSDMVARFQEAMGQEVTGELSLGTVAMATESARIGEHLTEVGEFVHDATPVLGITNWTREVISSVPPLSRDRIQVGLEIKVRLPDRSTVDATVERISPTVGVDSGDYEAVLSVPDIIDLRNDRLDVTVIGSELVVSDALVVEPNAILELEGNRYALRIPSSDGGSVELVEIKVLGVAGRQAAVSGPVSEGTVVLSN